MKISIRQGVFETNSSSVHTFSIKPFNGELKGMIGWDDLTIREDEFGWGPERYDDWQSKTAYLLQVAKDCSRYDEVFKEVESIMKEAGAEQVILRGNGYVDHGWERSKLIDFVMESRQNMLDYIFGNGFILIDNDQTNDYKDRWESEGLNVTEGAYGKELIKDKYTFNL